MKTDMSKLTLKALVKIYNECAHVAKKPEVTKFADRAAAERRVLAMVDAAGKQLGTHDDGRYFLLPKGKKVVVAGEPANDNMKIKVVVAGNPKQHGTNSFKRFAKYSSGITVAEYVAAVSKLVPRKKALADIRYDAERDYIKLVA